MTKTEALRRVRKHYKLTRPVTEQELAAEVRSLKRGHNNGTLCDFASALYCAIEPYLTRQE